jgi:hypothetical protein
MAILDVDLTDVRGLSKRDQRAAFQSWKETKCPNPNSFSFEGKKEFIKGKERVWTVVSFGDYVDASNRYRRFISYRCGLGTLSRVYSWVWDETSSTWQECALTGFGSW